jgi:hypothetical protein
MTRIAFIFLSLNWKHARRNSVSETMSLLDPQSVVKRLNFKKQGFRRPRLLFTEIYPILTSP